MNATPSARAGRREWIGLAVLMLPTLLIAMDTTVLHLAVPALTTHLRPTSSQLLWITDIYGFMIAGSLITMGTLGDRIGRRKLLLIGGVAFALASILAAFSNSAEMLIFSRAVLGIAGATLMPSTMSLIRNMFLDPRQRTVAIGVWVSGFSLGGAVGPLVGGALLEHFWWGSVFLISVPVMVVLLIAGSLILPEYRDPHPGRFDFPSAVMSLAAVLLVIFGLKQFAEYGLSQLAAASVVVGLIIGFAFIQRQRFLADPLIDLRLFSRPSFTAALATYTFGIFAAFGSFLFVAQYLQLVLGLSPLQAGLWSAPGSVASVIGSNLAPRIVRRVRPAYVVASGLLLASVGLGIMTQSGMDSLALIVIGNTLMSLGFGITFALTVDLVVATAPPERAGAASAIAETGAEFGGALGLALLGSLGMAIYRSQLIQNMPAGLTSETMEAARETLGAAILAAAELPQELGAALVRDAREAFISGLHATSLIGAVGFIVLITIVVVLLRDVEPHTEGEDFIHPIDDVVPNSPRPSAQAGD